MSLFRFNMTKWILAANKHITWKVNYGTLFRYKDIVISMKSHHFHHWCNLIRRIRYAKRRRFQQRLGNHLWCRFVPPIIRLYNSSNDFFQFNCQNLRDYLSRIHLDLIHFHYEYYHAYRQHILASESQSNSQSRLPSTVVRQHKTLQRSTMYASMENRRRPHHSVLPKRNYSVSRSCQPPPCQAVEEASENRTERDEFDSEPTFDEKYGSLCEIDSDPLSE